MAAAIAVAASGCEKWMERHDPASVDATTYWKNRDALEQYTNGFLESYTPGEGTIAYSYDSYSDIIQARNQNDFLQTAWTSSQQGSWGKDDWNFIYNIEYFLDNFRNVPGLSEEVYDHYEGVARFWRAWHYFTKVQLFGAVPYYDYVIEPDDEGLYKARDSREYVCEKILEDLDFAAEHVSTDSQYLKVSKINRYVALFVKAKFCLWEGTFRKYHSVDPATGRAWSSEYTTSEEFLRAACDACEELMEKSPFSLATGISAADRKSVYRSLFINEAINHQEVLWAREYNDGLNVWHNVTWYFCSGSMGQGWSLDSDFVAMYLKTDGSRVTDDADWKSMQYAEVFADRDYRLAQTVISPEYRKYNKAGLLVPTAPNFAVTGTGYQIIKWNIDNEAYEASKISNNSLPIMRYAEVLLNYAEAKAELGEMTDDVWDRTIRLLRERSGVNGDRPATADNYLADYYAQLDGSKISDKDILEVRRERSIELISEGDTHTNRWFDLLRWHLGHKAVKQWYGIYVPALKTPIDLNGDGINDVCVVAEKKDIGSETGVTYINLGEGQFRLEEGDHGRLMYIKERYWEEAKYLRPIPYTTLQINTNLTQNVLWEGR